MNVILHPNTVCLTFDLSAEVVLQQPNLDMLNPMLDDFLNRLEPMDGEFKSIEIIYSLKLISVCVALIAHDNC